jgi:hypothetical protein
MDRIKLLTIAGLVGCILAIYLSFRKKRQYYTTSNGSWIIKWSPPTVGTPPISYNYTIVDEKNNKMVDSTTTSTSITLDPTIFVPNSGDVMSNKVYTASINPSNAQGSGPVDTFTFSLYDTPNMITLTNDNSAKIIYPSNPQDPKAIFRGPDLTSQMTITLNDNVVASNLKLTITDKDQIITPYAITPLNPTPNSESYKWQITWTDQNGDLYSFPSGDTVTLAITVTNPAGTFSWSQDYTVPIQTFAPGSIDASSYFQPSS